jgi:hypothetical protein
MSRNTTTVLVVLAFLMVTALITAISSSEGGSKTGLYLWLLFALISVVGRVARVMAQPRPFDPAEPMPDDIRFGESRGTQLVGATCAVCGKKIAVVSDELACATCQAPVHRRNCRQEDESLHGAATTGG